MKKDFNEFRVRTIFSSILTLLPTLIGILIWNKIPNSLMPNSNLAPEVESPIYKILLVFGLPILMMVLNLICLNITFKDKSNKDQSRKILNSLFYICPAISIMSSLILYNAILGNTINHTRILPFIFGVGFILLGNNLPKVKPNSTYGIKLSWTLKNKENWTKTHRFSGLLWFIGGLCLLFLPALSLNFIIPSFIGILLICTIAPIIFSFIYYKKQVKDGTYTIDSETQNVKSSKSVIAVIVIIVFAILTIIATGSIDTKPGIIDVEVDASYYIDIMIPYEDIEYIEYRDYKDIGTKVSGFGSLKLSLGTFKNDEFGTYTCYVYNHTDSCIVIKTSDDFVVLNSSDDENTMELYKDLAEKMQ